MKLHTIKNARPIDGLGRLWIDFDDENDVVVDLAPILAQGGVFEPIRKWHFHAVEVGPRGRSILWRIEGDEAVNLCADVLWLMAHPQDRKAVVTRVTATTPTPFATQ